MMTIQALDAVFLLILAAHMVIMLNRKETATWEHALGRLCLIAVGALSAKLAIDGMTIVSQHTLEFWTELGFHAALASFIVLRVWWPRTTADLHTASR